MTTTTKTELEPGDTVHALDNLVLLTGDSATLLHEAHIPRGGEFTVTQALLDANADRNGVCWLHIAVDPAAQRERWGRERMGLGPFPAGLDTFEPNSIEWEEALANARDKARSILDPGERRAAYEAIERRFGRQITSRSFGTVYR